MLKTKDKKNILNTVREKWLITNKGTNGSNSRVLIENIEDQRSSATYLKHSKNCEPTTLCFKYEAKHNLENLKLAYWPYKKVVKKFFRLKASNPEGKDIKKLG